MSAVLCSVRILCGLLWNAHWLVPGTVVDMARDRATELANSKPQPGDYPADAPAPKGFVEILGEATGAEVVPVPAPAGPTTISRDIPLEPATLQPVIPTIENIDTLANCPSAEKIKEAAITTVDQLTALMTLHGDGFGKLLKLTKAEASAVADWITAQNTAAAEPAAA
jgi:hypothetical protein